MKLADFDYKLPKKSIAQKPKHPRDHSRLLVYDRKKDKISHKKFYQITDFLQTGDLLVFNNSKVFPARLLGKKQTGGKVEILLLEQIKAKIWKVMLGAKNKKIGMKIFFDKDLSAKVIKRINDLEWEIKFNYKGDLIKKIEKIGLVPLPPYIKSKEKQTKLKLVSSVAERKQYQTIYAKKYGSAAAPTAGLHFTNKVLNQLKKKGVNIAYVTLHVGLGTFAPVRTQDIKKHKLHAEKVEITLSNIKKILKAKKQNKRIIAVGTTSVRVLEGVLGQNLERFKKQKKAWQGQVNIFIYPDYEFKIINGLITNFHLPKSSLIMLVAALTGRTKILDIYNMAIKKGYRFYSFGDAMLII